MRTYNNFSYSEFVSLAGLSCALVGFAIGSQPWVIILSLVPFLCTSLGLFEYASDLLRVFTLAYFCHVRPNVISHRKEDIDHLRKFVQSNVSPGKFLLVHGHKGIGKSCAIKTALSIFRAVYITSPISSGLCSTDILQIVFSELTQTDKDSKKRALNICELYKWMFKESPVIVLCARERLNDAAPFADIPEAARLISELGYRVIVDSSDNAFPFERLTDRCKVFEMKPMSDEVLINIPEFSSLMKFLEEKKLLDISLSTCGGSPLHFSNLLDCFMDAKNEQEKINSIFEFIEKTVLDAKTSLEKFIIANPKTKESLDSFRKGTHELDKTSMTKLFGENIDFKNVLRMSKSGQRYVYIPASRAMALSLCIEFKGEMLISLIKKAKENNQNYPSY